MAASPLTLSSGTPPTQVAAAGGNFGSLATAQIQPGLDMLVSSKSTTAHSFTVHGRGGPTFTRNLPGLGGTVFRGAGISWVQIDATDSNVLWELGPEGCFTYAEDGQLLATPSDNLGNSLLVTYAGGVAAPVQGIWRVQAWVTDVNGITLADGTNTKKLAVNPSADPSTTVANVIYTLAIPVKLSVTYTLGGTGITLVGAVGVIAPS